LALMQAALSDRGFTLARNIMKLNYAIGEITGHWDEYGEFLYWLSVFGEPSAQQPWGWPSRGHPLIITCSVTCAPLVVTPMFMGSERTYASSGKYAGTRTFAAEEQTGLSFARGLTADQRKSAVLFPSILSSELPNGKWHPTEGRIQGRALRDNLELGYE